MMSAKKGTVTAGLQFLRDHVQPAEFKEYVQSTKAYMTRRKKKGEDCRGCYSREGDPEVAEGISHNFRVRQLRVRGPGGKLVPIEVTGHDVTKRRMELDLVGKKYKKSAAADRRKRLKIQPLVLPGLKKSKHKPPELARVEDKPAPARSTGVPPIPKPALKPEPVARPAVVPDAGPKPEGLLERIAWSQEQMVRAGWAQIDKMKEQNKRMDGLIQLLSILLWQGKNPHPMDPRLPMTPQQEELKKQIEQAAKSPAPVFAGSPQVSPPGNGS